MLPIIDTSRLLIRPRTIQDLEQCVAMDRDPLVTKYVPGPWSDAAKHRAFVLSRMNCVYPDGLGYWSVMKKEETKAFLGWILLLPYQKIADEIEIGWRFIPRSWGKGFATEAASAVLQHAFETLRLEYIVADIDPRNTASIRVAEKIGMRFTENRNFDGEMARSYQICADRK